MPYKPVFYALLLGTALPTFAQTSNQSAGQAPEGMVTEPMPTNSDGYKLGPREKLFVRIGSWDSATQTYVSWTDATGEYSIGADGYVSIPMAGSVMASGLTAEELAQAIITQIQDGLGVTSNLDASVEVAEYRPVYVIGEVQTPGAIPFAPGMNAIEAVGLAGGFRRPETTFLQNERSALASLGNYEVLRVQLYARLAQKARLEAELSSNRDLVPDKELANALGADELLRREREVKAARDAEIKSQMVQLTSLEKLLTQEIDRLGQQVELRSKQIELAKEELENTTQLVEKGLTVASRRSDLQTRVADEEVRLLELETARLTAEQRVVEVTQERSDILNARKRDILDNLSVTESEIGEIRIKQRTEAALYSEALQSGDGFVSTRGFGAPILELARRQNGKLVSIPVERDTSLQPGDVLEIRLPLPDEMSSPALAAKITEQQAEAIPLPASR